MTSVESIESLIVCRENVLMTKSMVYIFAQHFELVHNIPELGANFGHIY